MEICYSKEARVCSRYCLRFAAECLTCMEEAVGRDSHVRKQCWMFWEPRTDNHFEVCQRSKCGATGDNPETQPCEGTRLTTSKFFHRFSEISHSAVHLYLTFLSFIPRNETMFGRVVVWE